MARKEKKQHTHPLLRYWIKLTGILIVALVNRPKVFFANRGLQGKHFKGGALLVSNHRSYWDYISYFFLFPFNLIRPVVSYEIYHKNKVLTFFLDLIGAIPLGENPADFSWMKKTIELLKKGKKVIIFPEAHFIQEDKLATFHSSYILIARSANVPIIPLYTDGNYHSWKRNRVGIGTKIYLNSSKENNSREELNSYVIGKIEELSRNVKANKGHHLFSFKNFLWDLGRITVYFHLGIAFRPKAISLEKNKTHRKNGTYILAANHTRFVDPFILLCVFWRKRVKILAADVVYGLNNSHPVRAFLLNQGGCVKISRESLDLEAVSNCCKSLKKGYPLMVFPEGHIKRNGEMDALKNGSSMMASRCSCPIIPSYIVYGKKWYNRTKVYFGKEIYPPKDKTIKGISQMTQEVHEELERIKIIAEKENGR